MIAMRTSPPPRRVRSVGVAALVMFLASINCGRTATAIPDALRVSAPLCPGVDAERVEQPSAVPEGLLNDTARLYLATGSATGSYVRLGDAISKSINTSPKLTPCVSGGSRKNLDLLKQGKV